MGARYLENTYHRLFSYFGPQHWWPADSAFEVVVGAILTQNTAWANVEKAVAALKQQRLLSPKRLFCAKTEKIAQLIRPCGYYNLKARRLKNFLAVLFSEFRGNLSSMFSLSRTALRKRLLKINGLGPETADSILLYAANKPIFVVDAYTKRFLLRHRIIGPEATYQHIQSLFEDNLMRKRSLFNEYHALLVRLGKEFCRKKPLCSSCPLRNNKRKRLKVWK